MAGAVQTPQIAAAYETPPDEEERPLRSHAALMGVFLTLVGSFFTALRRSGRSLPERFEPEDLALIAIATHKGSRILTRAKVASFVRAPFTEYQGRAGHGEVEEKPTGQGLRRAVGELLVCPYCIGVWIATGLSAGLVVAPRATRFVCSILSAVTGADFLQLAYKRLCRD